MTTHPTDLDTLLKEAGDQFDPLAMLRSADALLKEERAKNERLERERAEAIKPLKDTVNRILDEHSAWIAQPNPDVASRIAFAAAVAVSVQFETRPDPELYVPGEFRCAKCGFTLSQFRMRADDGAVGSRDEPGERCPNDGAPLWRVTWRQRAEEHYSRAAEEMRRAEAAEASSLTARRDAFEEAAKRLDIRASSAAADRDSAGRVGMITLAACYARSLVLTAAAEDLRTLAPTVPGGEETPKMPKPLLPGPAH